MIANGFTAGLLDDVDYKNIERKRSFIERFESDALQIRLQGVELPIIGIIPVQFIQAIPYVLTVVLLAGFVGKAIAPNAIGQPYTKEG